jgi:hypothetical protein
MLSEERLDALGSLGGDIGELVGEYRVLCATTRTASPSVPSQSPLRVGNKVLIRSVTHYYTGLVAFSDEHSILLDDAAWIADTGRYADALKTGGLGEVEPIIGPVLLGRGALIDCVDWRWPLPKAQK